MTLPHSLLHPGSKTINTEEKIRRNNRTKKREKEEEKKGRKIRPKRKKKSTISLTCTPSL